MRFSAGSALRATFCALLAIAGTAPAAPREYPEHESFMVAMTDHTRLNTTVYYPQDGGDPWPVVLYRTPYGIQGDNVWWFANFGYVAVCQDTRGRHGSEGVDQMFRDDGWGPDHTDGLDTVHWILTQPWCDGTIGTYGASARGITQNMLAGALPESVRCMEVTVAPSNWYEHLAFPGGAFRKYAIETWLTEHGSPHMLDSLYAHPNDDEWWSWLSPESRHHLQTIPTYQIGGWSDLNLQGCINSFTGLQYGGADGALGNQKLLIGPWSHSSGTGGQVGELFYPDAGYTTPNDLIGNTWEWLDCWMRDISNDIMEKPPVVYYMMGDGDDPLAPGNEWRTAGSWPPPSQELNFYLRAGGLLGSAPPPEFEDPESYAYDPTDPVPTLGGANLYMPSGPYDQRPVLYRPDVLVYQTDVLAEPLEVGGPVRVNLHISSDRLDTDFTAKLCDVYPDGRVMLVCDGILRARHHNSLAEEDLLVPGAIYSLTINLGETALAFNTGHQILVAISSSNSPRFDANPNTGDPFMQHTKTLVATNTIYHDPQYPSCMTMRALLSPQGVSDNWRRRAGAGGIRLLTSRPNPFQSSATIRYELGRASPVRLGVFDLSGRLLRVLVDSPGEQPGGHIVRWDSRDEMRRPMAAGMYYLRLDAAGERRQQPAVLLR